MAVSGWRDELLRAKSYELRAEGQELRQRHQTHNAAGNPGETGDDRQHAENPGEECRLEDEIADQEAVEPEEEHPGVRALRGQPEQSEYKRTDRFHVEHA